VWRVVPRGSSAPGEPIGSGFSALIFFGSFLYQDKKERLACFLQNSAPGSSFQNYSAPSGLVKIVRSIQGAAPLAIYYAPSGLKTSDKFFNP